MSQLIISLSGLQLLPLGPNFVLNRLTQGARPLDSPSLLPDPCPSQLPARSPQQPKPNNYTTSAPPSCSSQDLCLTSAHLRQTYERPSVQVAVHVHHVPYCMHASRIHNHKHYTGTHKGMQIGLESNAHVMDLKPFVHTYKHRCVDNTCIHTYMHTYIHGYIHTYIQTYIHTCKQIYIHFIHGYIHKCIYMYIRTHLHTYLPSYLPTDVRAYMHPRRIDLCLDARRIARVKMHRCIDACIH